MKNTNEYDKLLSESGAVHLSESDAKCLSEHYSDFLERNPEAAKYIAFREALKKTITQKTKEKPEN